MRGTALESCQEHAQVHLGSVLQNGPPTIAIFGTGAPASSLVFRYLSVFASSEGQSTRGGRQRPSEPVNRTGEGEPEAASPLD